MLLCLLLFSQFCENMTRLLWLTTCGSPARSDQSRLSTKPSGRSLTKEKARGLLADLIGIGIGIDIWGTCI
ncbi:hypothetical protein F5Y11DRAFT_311038 [Daldinia sp. FL1419]|nr:hypothetical protein F5Y11DRAFT_311038 [Daldinia sp. FL1419]